MKTEPMALATGVDFATVCNVAHYATVQAKLYFHQPIVMLPDGSTRVYPENPNWPTADCQRVWGSVDF